MQPNFKPPDIFSQSLFQQVNKGEGRPLDSELLASFDL
jgi:hypothetical protein